MKRETSGLWSHDFSYDGNPRILAFQQSLTALLFVVLSDRL